MEDTRYGSSGIFDCVVGARTWLAAGREGGMCLRQDVGETTGRDIGINGERRG